MMLWVVARTKILLSFLEEEKLHLQQRKVAQLMPVNKQLLKEHQGFLVAWAVLNQLDLLQVHPELLHLEQEMQ